MKPFSFLYEKTSLVTHDVLKESGERLKPEIERIHAARAEQYNTAYAFTNLVQDVALRQTVHQLAEQKKMFRPTALVVIGIGGSNLGTMAVHEALYGKFYNQYNPDLKVYFADTVDTDYIWDIVLLIEQELEKGNNVIINVISKSGGTTETIANFELFLELLKRYDPKNYRDYIVVTTDEQSSLWQLAQEQQFTSLIIPRHVGGRYSVLSAVGLFPLAMLGIDIDALHAGAQSIMTMATDSDIMKNHAAISAIILADQYAHGCTMHDTFLFSVDLESLGKWYRQLMGESIGKEFTTTNEQKFIGITPTVSLGSTDLHSVGQLYLGGPYDKFTTFVSIAKNKSNVVLPVIPAYEKLVAKIQGKTLACVMDAIIQGVQQAYYKHKRPYVSLVLPEKNAYSIGQFLQFKMMEMVYLAYLLEVNPFDQPQVELYKKETKEILTRE
jgi:glucose-6-phosphate isomerase